jgi:pantothenate kinase type III
MTDDPVQRLLETCPIAQRSVDDVVPLVLSLPPGLRQQLTGKLDERQLADRSMIVADPMDCWPIRMDYGTPGAVGTDRLAASLGAWARQPGVGRIWVITAGTAITINAVEGISRDPVFRGGAILAGYRATLRGLAQAAPTLSAAIAAVEENLDMSRPLRSRTSGRNTTISNLQVGVGMGIPGSVYACLLSLGLKEAEPVWITGGDGKRLQQGLRKLFGSAKHMIRTTPHLVLEGLALYADSLVFRN